MKTSEVIEKQFTEELETLLRKYNAELFADDCAHCGTRSKICVDISGVYDENGKTISQWTQLDLGKSVK